MKDVDRHAKETEGLQEQLEKMLKMIVELEDDGIKLEAVIENSSNEHAILPGEVHAGLEDRITVPEGRGGRNVLLKDEANNNTELR